MNGVEFKKQFDMSFVILKSVALWQRSIESELDSDHRPAPHSCLKDISNRPERRFDINNLKRQVKSQF